MCERRGYAILIQGGDPQIRAALAEPLKARLEQLRPPEPAKPPVDWAKVARRVKVAVGNTKGAEDYAILRAAAEQEYRMPELTRLARARERLLALYALAWLRIQTMFDWEGAQWRGE